MGNDPQLALLAMPQLAEAVDKEDDWTGLTDAAARRKRQNRLNVRAHRRRRKALTAQEKKLDSSVLSHRKIEATEPNIPCWLEDQQNIVLLPFSTAKSLYDLRTPMLSPLSARSHSFLLNRTSAARIMFPISSDHLIALIQFNVLRAAVSNRLLVSSIRPIAAKDTCSSVALQVLPVSDDVLKIPPSLQPTYLQSTIPHQDWLESIPHPKWRDNILLALGTFDAHQLWLDAIGGLFEGFPASETEQHGLMVWGTPWDTDGWEISEGFYVKWKFLFKGCEDSFVSTNKWRVLRGEKPLNFGKLALES